MAGNLSKVFYDKSWSYGMKQNNCFQYAQIYSPVSVVVVVYSMDKMAVTYLVWKHSEEIKMESNMEYDEQKVFAFCISFFDFETKLLLYSQASLVQLQVHIFALLKCNFLWRIPFLVYLAVL